MKKIMVKWCKIAEEDHKKQKREYCHTFHRKNTICTCNAFYDLPDRYRLAILAHEIGHLLCGPDGNEDDANRKAIKLFRVEIYYEPRTIHGNHLEAINAEDVGYLRWQIERLLF